MLFEEKQMDYVIYVQFDFKSISHLRGFIEEKNKHINKRPSIIFAFYRHNCRITLLLKFIMNLLLGSRCYLLSWAMSSLLFLEEEGKQLFNLCQSEVLSSYML